MYVSSVKCEINLNVKLLILRVVNVNDTIASAIMLSKMTMNGDDILLANTASTRPISVVL